MVHLKDAGENLQRYKTVTWENDVQIKERQCCFVIKELNHEYECFTVFTCWLFTVVSNCTMGLQSDTKLTQSCMQPEKWPIEHVYAKRVLTHSYQSSFSVDLLQIEYTFRCYCINRSSYCKVFRMFKINIKNKIREGNMLWQWLVTLW